MHTEKYVGIYVCTMLTCPARLTLSLHIIATISMYLYNELVLPLKANKYMYKALFVDLYVCLFVCIISSNKFALTCIWSTIVRALLTNICIVQTYIHLPFCYSKKKRILSFSQSYAYHSPLIIIYITIGMTVLP